MIDPCDLFFYHLSLFVISSFLSFLPSPIIITSTTNNNELEGVYLNIIINYGN